MITEAGEKVMGNFDQELFLMEMSDLDTGEVKQFWADSGIRGQLKLSKIAADTPIEIEHTGQKALDADGDRPACKVQTYDIYELNT